MKHYDQPNSHFELLTLQDYDFFTQWVTHNHFHKEDNILITFLSQIIKGINQVLSIFYKRSFSFTVVIPPKYWLNQRLEPVKIHISIIFTEIVELFRASVWKHGRATWPTLWKRNRSLCRYKSLTLRSQKTTMMCSFRWLYDNEISQRSSQILPNGPLTVDSPDVYVTSELSPVLWPSPLELPVLVSLARGGFQVLSWVERL